MRSQFKYTGKLENLVVGEGCTITRSPWPLFDLTSGLVFGDNVTISSGVYILTHDHYFNQKDWRNLDEKLNPTPTVIGHGVFLGVNAIITSGCRSIGKHSVIGAGAVVTKTVPSYEIWAGNPAKKIRSVGGQNG